MSVVYIMYIESILSYRYLYIEYVSLVKKR